jgi:hypothetical protein
MRLSLSVLALTACVLAADAAAAKKKEEPHYQPPPPTIVATPLALAIAGFDRDGDMIVTRAEFDAGVQRSFAFGDKDRDGKMSLLELADWSEVVLGSRGALPGQFDFDTSGDDSISHDEFIGYFNARFLALDVNKDGALERSELVSFAPQAPGRREHGHGPRQEGGEGPPR